MIIFLPIYQKGLPTRLTVFQTLNLIHLFLYLQSSAQGLAQPQWSINIYWMWNKRRMCLDFYHWSNPEAKTAPSSQGKALRAARSQVLGTALRTNPSAGGPQAADAQAAYQEQSVYTRARGQISSPKYEANDKTVWASRKSSKFHIR